MADLSSAINSLDEQQAKYLGFNIDNIYLSQGEGRTAMSCVFSFKYISVYPSAVYEKTPELQAQI